VVQGLVWGTQMTTCKITIEFGDQGERMDYDNFDPALLHPDRRIVVVLVFERMMARLAEKLGVYDEFVESYREIRDVWGAEEFEAMMANMDPTLRPKLVAAGLLVG
jgi:hypothetical protein